MVDRIIAVMPETGATLLDAGVDSTGEQMVVRMLPDGSKAPPALLAAYLRHPGWEMQGTFADGFEE